MSRKLLLLLIFALLPLACQKSAPPTPATVTASEDDPPETLAAYALFDGAPTQQEPAAGVLPYDLNSPLFSDYTAKHRFIKLPPGQAMKYEADGVLGFPVGTIIAKTFAYPVDQRDPKKGERLIETRILKKQADGNWAGLPYRWNAEQTEAKLTLAGGTQNYTWTHFDGKERKNNYIIPNANQCKNCHENNRLQEPIGPKARHLNRTFASTQSDSPSGSLPPGGGGLGRGGRTHEGLNQLQAWHDQGKLTGLPLKDVPKLAVWNNPATGTLEQRARAWLEINCAHCHNPAGPARTSGLDLRYAQTTPVKWGLWKTPVAAGRGSGGRHYDIVPGKPDESILVFRIESSEPGVMMPELPRRMVDDEGVKLIREWIAAMPPGKPPGTTTTSVPFSVPLARRVSEGGGILRQNPFSIHLP